jgi:hypothetical protein
MHLAPATTSTHSGAPAPLPEPEAHAYTDGASTGSRGPGGYGAVMTSKGNTEEIRAAPSTRTAPSSRRTARWAGATSPIPRTGRRCQGEGRATPAALGGHSLASPAPRPSREDSHVQDGGQVGGKDHRPVLGEVVERFLAEHGERPHQLDEGYPQEHQQVPADAHPPLDQPPKQPPHGGPHLTEVYSPTSREMVF